MRHFQGRAVATEFSKGVVADSDKIVISTIQRLWCKLSGIPVPAKGDEGFETERADRLAGSVASVSYCPDLPPDFRQGQRWSGTWLGDPAVVLVLDETAFLKKGYKSVGVAAQ
jgi:hypothetical protein